MKPRAFLLLAALALSRCAPGVALADPPVPQVYPNPSFPDSGDNDPSLLGKLLLLEASGAQPGSAHVAWIEAYD